IQPRFISEGEDAVRVSEDSELELPRQLQAGLDASLRTESWASVTEDFVQVGLDEGRERGEPARLDHAVEALEPVARWTRHAVDSVSPDLRQPRHRVRHRGASA